ncbi:LppU/SCO3897 family protein [Salininema proteolyticum]|uniref:Uncharacterized protein n=1 Tax=Salininema proteolyticum TaxID=1607685 RepID=A0ABV8U2K7_9ACTN
MTYQPPGPYPPEPTPGSGPGSTGGNGYHYDPTGPGAPYGNGGTQPDPYAAPGGAPGSYGGGPYSAPGGQPGPYGTDPYGSPGPYGAQSDPYEAQPPAGPPPGFPSTDQAAYGGPAPSPGSGNGTVIAVIAVVAVLLLGGGGIAAYYLTNDDDSSASPSAAGAQSDSDGNGSEDTDLSDETVEDDPILNATAGDCFTNNGSETSPDLVEATCGTGTFSVLEVRNGTDGSVCEGNPEFDYYASYPSDDVLLCLTYDYGGDAYHAQVDDCVYGASSGDDWNKTDCQTGAFRVLERFDGQTDESACTQGTYYNYYMTFSVSEPYLSRLLCMSFIYPDDAGYATKDNCLNMTGDPSSASFEFVDCDNANVYVTGRTNEFNAQSFCGNHGWTTWESYDFDDMAYTVCWAYT